MCGSGALDARALLREHARTFGGYDDALASLPRTFEGNVNDDGHKGTAWLYLDRSSHRLDVYVGGRDAGRPWRAFISSGIDEHGAWELPMTGALSRTAGEDADDEEIIPFIFRREYLRSDRTPTETVCRDVSGRPLVWMTFAMQGGPKPRTFRLGFEPDTARLVEYELSAAMPSRSCETTSTDPTSMSLRCTPRDREYGRIPAWPARGAARASFPTALSLSGPVSEPITFTRETSGLRCADGACTRAATPVMEARWPASGVVSLPMLFYGNHVFVRADIQGKRTWVIVDSGASMLALDSLAPLGQAVKPAFAERASGATQQFDFGATEISWVSLGAFSLSHVPTAVVPMPPLASYSVTRPQALLGAPVFQTAAVRIDFEAGAITLAKDVRQLPQDGERLPLRFSRGRLVVRATVNGITDDFQIDTGDANALSLEEAWVTEHRITDLAAAKTVTSQSGAGTEATQTARFPLREASIGPLHVDAPEANVSIDAPPEPGLAGRIGNALLSRCAAITVDVAGGAMWLTPPCTPKTEMPSKASNVAFVLDHVDDFEDTPWILSRVDETSAFHRAGLQAGDRLLRVAGKTVGLSLAALKHALDVPPGTVVTVRVLRGHQELSFDVKRAPE